MSQRIALGLSYSGQGHHGWQSQPDGKGVQDILERALEQFAQSPIRTLCAGRTDAGVHGLMQVVHFDTDLDRPLNAWVRGTNAHLPAQVAVQWAHAVPAEFHARASALARRYIYVLLESPVRPSLEHGRVGWVFKPLDATAMQQAARLAGHARLHIVSGCAMPIPHTHQNLAPHPDRTLPSNQPVGQPLAL